MSHEDDLSIKAFVDGKGIKPDTTTEGLPLTTDPVLEHLLAKYNADGSYEASIVAGRSGEKTIKSPFWKAVEVAETEFGSIGNIEGEQFISPFLDWLKKEFPLTRHINAATMGAGIVVSAFSHLYKGDLLQEMAEIESARWSKAFSKVSLPTSREDLILTRRIGSAAIPNHQVGLATFLDRFSETYVNNDDRPFVKKGAGGMYSALEHLWNEGAFGSTTNQDLGFKTESG